MPNNIDNKLIISLIAVVLDIYGYFPYFRDIFRKKTKPHLYTWLIWAITQGTATVIIWQGGGKYAVLSFVLGTILVVSIFLLSFKYGTKNITRSDIYVLFVALSAIIVWWGLENPLLAILMVSVIDGLAYIPTIRKSFEEPWSETLLFWFVMASINILIIISISEYNLLTVTYPATLLALNIFVWCVCFFRRKMVLKPKFSE